MAPLLLQQPASKPTYKKNAAHLDRRLELWEAGNFQALVSECETIQKQMLTSKKAPTETTLAKRFATMVFNNNFKGAMSLIADKGKGGGLLKVCDKERKRCKENTHTLNPLIPLPCSQAPSLPLLTQFSSMRSMPSL